MAKNVPGFGPQKVVTGKYTADVSNPLADENLMSKKPDNRSTNKAFEDFSIGRTQNDTPRPQVQSHGGKEG
jgi:hypothetical protein